MPRARAYFDCREVVAALKQSGAIPSQQSIDFRLEVAMHPISMMVVTLFVGALILMAGIWVGRDSGQSIRSTVKECLAWGSGFCIALGAQIAAIATLS